MASRLCYAFWKFHVGVSAQQHFYPYKESTFPQRLMPIRRVDVVVATGVEKVTYVMPWSFNMLMPVGPDFCYEVESGRRAQPIIVRCKCRGADGNTCRSATSCDCLAADLDCTYFCENKGDSGRGRRGVLDRLQDFWYPVNNDGPVESESREILTARATKARRDAAAAKEAQAQAEAEAADAQAAAVHADEDAVQAHAPAAPVPGAVPGAAVAPVRTAVPRRHLLATFFPDEADDPFAESKHVLAEQLEDNAGAYVGGGSNEDRAEEELGFVANLGEQEQHFYATQRTETTEQDEAAETAALATEEGDGDSASGGDAQEQVYGDEDDPGKDDDNFSDEEILQDAAEAALGGGAGVDEDDDNDDE